MEWQTYYILAMLTWSFTQSWYAAGRGYFDFSVPRVLVSLALAPVSIFAVATAGGPGVPWQHITMIGLTSFGVASSLSYLVQGGKRDDWGAGSAVMVTLLLIFEGWLYFTGLS